MNNTFNSKGFTPGMQKTIDKNTAKFIVLYGISYFEAMYMAEELEWNKWWGGICMTYAEYVDLQVAHMETASCLEQ